MAFFGHYIFEKHFFFFGLKNQTLNEFVEPKISFYITFLHSLTALIPYGRILQNYFGPKIFGILTSSQLQKKQIFLDQKHFLRYVRMVLGMLRTCKEVMKNKILMSINLFKR